MAGGMTAEAQAIDMLNLFATVGAQRFDVTFTDIEGKKLSNKGGFLPNRHISELRRTIGPMLREAAQAQHNVIIRPRPTSVAFIQLDDPPPASIERLKHVAFLVERTSATGFQLWLALDEKPDLEFKRRLKKGAGADIMATNATRISGSINFKKSYAPAFPRVEIVHSAPGLVTTRAALESLGILAPPEPVRQAPLRASLQHTGVRKWPSYRKCLDGAPLNQAGTGPDRSRADYTWCLTALDWGWSVEDVAAQLLEESAKARERGQDYATQTARSAAEAVERRPGRSMTS
jgi:hypothetical protein